MKITCSKIYLCPVANLLINCWFGVILSLGKVTNARAVTWKIMQDNLSTRRRVLPWISWTSFSRAAFMPAIIHPRPRMTCHTLTCSTNNELANAINYNIPFDKQLKFIQMFDFWLDLTPGQVPYTINGKDYCHKKHFLKVHASDKIFDNVQAQVNSLVE